MIPKVYEMKPIMTMEEAKAKNAFVIKPQLLKPRIGKVRQKTYFRILSMSEDKNSATICGNMTPEANGQLSVMDVDISRFVGTAWVGDIIAYEDNDAHFQNPVITHRAGQRHQHPTYLVTPDEK